MKQKKMLFVIVKFLHNYVFLRKPITVERFFFYILMIFKTLPVSLYIGLRISKQSNLGSLKIFLRTRRLFACIQMKQALVGQLSWEGRLI